MRHRVAYRKLGRVTEHRISMLRNQAVALLRNERIQTTVPRAKELRPFVERIITIAKRSLNAPEGSTHSASRRDGRFRVTSPIGRSSPSCSTTSRRATLSGPAATRACSGSVTVGATALKSPKSSFSEANTTRTRRRRPKRVPPKAPTSPRRRRWVAGSAKRWAAARKPTRTRPAARPRSIRPQRAPARRSPRLGRPAGLEKLRTLNFELRTENPDLRTSGIEIHRFAARIGYPERRGRRAGSLKFEV